MVSTKSLFSRLALLTMALAVAPVAVWSQVLDPSREVTFTSGAGLGTQVQGATARATSHSWSGDAVASQAECIMPNSYFEKPLEPGTN